MEFGGHVTHLSTDELTENGGRILCRGTRSRLLRDRIMPLQKRFTPTPQAHPHTDPASLTRRFSARRCGGAERGQQEGAHDARSPWGNRRPDRVRRLSAEQPAYQSGGAGTLETLQRGGGEPLLYSTILRRIFAPLLY